MRAFRKPSIIVKPAREAIAEALRAGDMAAYREAVQAWLRVAQTATQIDKRCRKVYTEKHETDDAGSGNPAVTGHAAGALRAMAPGAVDR